VPSAPILNHKTSRQKQLVRLRSSFCRDTASNYTVTTSIQQAIFIQKIFQLFKIMVLQKEQAAEGQVEAVCG
jgi:hypothetical protein